MKIKVAIVDDHKIISAMLADYINISETYEVLFISNNGRELLDALEELEEKPEFILLDIHMPVLNGFQTMLILRDSYPEIHVVILSMEDLESSVIQYLNLGAKGYLLKGMSSPEVIINCFEKILETGSSFPSFVTQEMLSAKNIEVLSKKWELTDRQMEFLRLTTQTAMTYKEIADVMCLSIKTIENYQASLFKQFDVKSRPGLMLFVQEHSLFSFKKH